MSTKKGKCNHDKFVQGQLGEECLKCGLLRTTIDYIEGYHQSEVVEWEKGVEHWAKNLEKMVNDINSGKCHKVDIPRHCIDFLKSYSSVLHHKIASAVEAREREISEAIKKMKTYTGGSSVEEKHKRVNKQEVLSIINK